MAIGHFIRFGDKTTCGGSVLEADTRVMMFGIAHAREGDRVSCGKDGKTYRILGGIPFINSHGRLVAGSLHSISSCPCRAKLQPSFFSATYESGRGGTRSAKGPASPTFQDSIRFAKSFAITDSDTGQPLANRAYIALVDGYRKVGRTDASGIAIVEAPRADSMIELHVVFQAPARDLSEFSEGTL